MLPEEERAVDPELLLLDPEGLYEELLPEERAVEPELLPELLYVLPDEDEERAVDPEVLL